MKKSPGEIALDRLIAALEAELLAASDAEIAEVLAERGIKLGSKGSAGLVDLTLPSAFRKEPRVRDDTEEESEDRNKQAPRGVHDLPRRP